MEFVGDSMPTHDVNRKLAAILSADAYKDQSISDNYINALRKAGLK
jgi:hypothetical protein